MTDKIAKPIVAEPVVEEPIPALESAEVPAEVKTEPIPEESITKFHEGYYRHSPLFYEVATYWDIKPEEYDAAKDKLSVLVDWAMLEGKSHKIEDILYQLRRLEENMQPPAWGERRYNKAYAYVRLKSQKKSIEKAMSAYEKNFQKEEVKDGE